MPGYVGVAIHLALNLNLNLGENSAFSSPNALHLAVQLCGNGEVESITQSLPRISRVIITRN